MSKIYYKVVSKELKSVCSTFSYLSFRKLAIQYKIGEFVQSDSGPLFVFKSYEDAKYFWSSNNGRIHSMYIYTCHIQSKCKIIALVNSYQIKRLLKTRQLKQSVTKFMKQLLFNKSIPEGTVAATKVKLLERVSFIL